MPVSGCARVTEEFVELLLQLPGRFELNRKDAHRAGSFDVLGTVVQEQRFAGLDAQPFEGSIRRMGASAITEVAIMFLLQVLRFQPLAVAAIYTWYSRP